MAFSPCSTGIHRKVTISWTPNATVANATHDLAVYRSRNGETRQLMFTEASPATVTSRTNVEAGIVTQALPPGMAFEINTEWSWELIKTSDGSIVEAGVMGVDSCFGVLC